MSATSRIPAALRHPLAGHAIRYAAAGALVFGVYVAATLLLSGPVGLPIQAAIALGYATAVVLHFVLQRVFVFVDRDEFELSTRHQVRAYLLLSGGQYAVTAVATHVLPDALGIDERLVYCGSALLVSGFVFVFLRTRVFHAA